MLLQQHDRLRELMVVAQALAARFMRGEPVGMDLEMRMSKLRQAFLEHNEFEEAMLEPMLRSTTDAWGAARVARMLEEHVAEHLEFRVALALPVAEIATRLEELAEDIDAHMAAEERTFLSPAVLRDATVDGGRRGRA